MEQEIVEVYHNVIDGNMSLEEFVEWVEARESNASMDVGYY